MKKLILISLLICSIGIYAQEKFSRFSYTFGTGASLLGTGDMIVLYVENEVDYKFNTHLSGAININYATSGWGVNEHASLIQEQVIAFLTPFKAKEINGFKLGIGITMSQLSNVYESGSTYSGTTLINRTYGYFKESSSSLILIIEDDYEITDRYLMGFKLFAQADATYGMLVKTGIKF
jgi:hypothetical protein